jgi:hypothetical protein
MSVSSPQPQAPLEEIAGLVERVTFFNAESGFAVLRVKVPGQRELVTVLGSLPSVSAGEWLTAKGCWLRDKEHGLQFKANALKALPPTTSEGVERYLGGGFVKGVGPVLAKKLVGHFGAGLLGVVGNSPASWSRSTGSGQSAGNGMHASFTTYSPAPICSAFAIRCLRSLRVASRVCGQKKANCHPERLEKKARLICGLLLSHLHKMSGYVAFTWQAEFMGHSRFCESMAGFWPSREVRARLTLKGRTFDVYAATNSGHRFDGRQALAAPASWPYFCARPVTKDGYRVVNSPKDFGAVKVVLATLLIELMVR